MVNSEDIKITVTRLTSAALGELLLEWRLNKYSVLIWWVAKE